MKDHRQIMDDHVRQMKELLAMEYERGWNDGNANGTAKVPQPTPDDYWRDYEVSVIRHPEHKGWAVTRWSAGRWLGLHDNWYGRFGWIVNPKYATKYPTHASAMEAAAKAVQGMAKVARPAPVEQAKDIIPKTGVPMDDPGSAFPGNRMGPSPLGQPAPVTVEPTLAQIEEMRRAGWCVACNTDGAWYITPNAYETEEYKTVTEAARAAWSDYTAKKEASRGH